MASQSLALFCNSTGPSPNDEVSAHTVVWKIFVWNYFVVGNIQEKGFHGCPVPTKIFKQRIKIVSSLIAYYITYYISFTPCRIDYQARTLESISNQWLCQIYLAS